MIEKLTSEDVARHIVGGAILRKFLDHHWSLKLPTGAVIAPISKAMATRVIRKFPGGLDYKKLGPDEEWRAKVLLAQPTS